MIPLLIYFSSLLHIPILVLFGFLLRGLPLLLMNVESELVATERERGRRDYVKWLRQERDPGVRLFFFFRVSRLAPN